MINAIVIFARIAAKCYLACKKKKKKKKKKERRKKQRKRREKKRRKKNVYEIPEKITNNNT